MDLLDALIDSWDRQCRIVNEVAGLVNESNKHLKATDDGFPIYEHLAHMHDVRKYFLGQLDAGLAGDLKASYTVPWETASEDLDLIKSNLIQSGKAVRDAVEAALKPGVSQSGWYDNPVLYLQHMVWHEGWHIGLILTALRIAGQEPSEEWSEAKVWGEWRTEVW